MTDVRLYQTPDGGEINYENGRLELSDTPESAVYLSLFGGNAEDSASEADDRKQWWGNRVEEDSTRHLRSRTQNLVRGLPSNSANLRRLDDAVQADLAWLVTAGVMASVEASVSLVSPKRIRIDGTMTTPDGTRYPFKVDSPW